MQQKQRTDCFVSGAGPAECPPRVCSMRENHDRRRAGGALIGASPFLPHLPCRGRRGFFVAGPARACPSDQ